MTLSDIATFSTAISGLAVTASLIYLALQTHQNAKHTRALIQQGRVNGIVTQYIDMADADLAAAHIVGNGGIATPDEIRRRQFWLECVGTLVRLDDTFSQHEEGLVSDDQFARSRAHMVRLLMEPGVRKYFVETFARGDLGASTKFQKFISQLLAETEVPATKTN